MAKSGLEIQSNVPLAPLTTLGIGGPARWFARTASEEDAAAALAWAAECGEPVFILGGGSNLLVADAGFAGLVVQICLKGIALERTDRVTVAAGEDWDGFVAACVERGLAGIECLSGIPGFAGGAPVQNVGAYGQEVSDTIVSVRAIDRLKGGIVNLPRDACGFAYRSSVFNTSERDRYLVLGVEYRLRPGGAPTLRYRDVQQRFAGRSDRPSLGEVRAAVRDIRRRKGMLLTPDDPDCRSAGSFFKNPIVSAESFRRITATAREDRLVPPDAYPPSYPAGEGLLKLPAAWLIEAAGFSRGYRRGPVRLSSKHVLAIVNGGGAGAEDVLQLVAEIQTGVENEFGIALVPEPVFVGFDPDIVRERRASAPPEQG